MEWDVRKEFKDETVRLADLVPPEGPPVLTEYRFENCNIKGPAVIYLDGEGSLDTCSFQTPSLSALWWSVDADERPEVIGAIALVSARFVNCRFFEIGIAGPENVKEIFRKTYEDN